MPAAAMAGLGLLALAAPAAAAGGGGGSASDLIYPWINFVLLIAVLVYVGRKPIRTYFRDRREEILTQLSDAAELHREAEGNYARWQRQLVDLESEIDQIRSSAQERAERESIQIIADAEASAERIKRGATAAIDQELRRAKDRLRAETSELAIELAAGILREQVTEQDRSRLLDEFISRIEQKPSAGATHGSSS